MNTNREEDQMRINKSCVFKHNMPRHDISEIHSQWKMKKTIMDICKQSVITKHDCYVLNLALCISDNSDPSIDHLKPYFDSLQYHFWRNHNDISRENKPDSNPMFEVIWKELPRQEELRFYYVSMILSTSCIEIDTTEYEWCRKFRIRRQKYNSLLEMKTSLDIDKTKDAVKWYWDSDNSQLIGDPVMFRRFFGNKYRVSKNINAFFAQAQPTCSQSAVIQS